jgi:quinol monooxygenase YgiN
MWAQLIKMRVKPGKEDQLEGLFHSLQEFEQPGSGLIRTLVMRDKNDPSMIYAMPMFESEEAARKRESDPVRQEGLKGVQATMADVFEAPAFVDLQVISEFNG